MNLNAPTRFTQTSTALLALSMFVRPPRNVTFIPDMRMIYFVERVPTSMNGKEFEMMDEKTLNRCVDCQDEFECSGEAIYPDYGLHCTHDRCGACQHKWLFGQGIAFPNPIQISLGITKSYTMALEDKDDHKNDDPDWEAKDEEERLANDIDPLTGAPYETRGMPQQKRRDPPMN